MSGGTRRRWKTVLAVVLGIALLGQPAASASDSDALTEEDLEAGEYTEFTPPADGEGEYLADPQTPWHGSTLQNNYPTAHYDLDGQQFGPLDLSGNEGSNRYLTSVAVSERGWPDGADTVVLATGEDYRDPLAASVLAGATDAPLLLTAEEYLEPGVANELERLDPDGVFVIGRLSDDVEDEVDDFGVDVERIGHRGHAGTARLIAERAVEEGADPSAVMLTAWRDFADALSASALAAGQGIPIVFAPDDDEERDDLIEWLEEFGTEETWVIGGTDAVTDDQIEGLPDPQRLAGDERTHTATRVADRAYSMGMDGTPVIAGSDTFADGLTGGVLAGAVLDAPVLLTPHRELYEKPAQWLGSSEASGAEIVGGTEAISDFTRCLLDQGDHRSFFCVEHELDQQHYHVGDVDGDVDEVTIGTFYAFQKVAGLEATGRFGQDEWNAMLERPTIEPERPDLSGDRVEIDVDRALVLVIRDHEVELVFHTTPGKASTPTIRGVYSVYEKRDVRQEHNAMYRPVFFIRGYAFHGYPDVPLYGASDGCARLFDADMDVLWDYLPMGHTIASY